MSFFLIQKSNISKIIVSIIFLLNATNVFTQIISETYTSGEIPTSYDSYDPTCNGPLTTLTIEIPSGSDYIVTGIDIVYEMTAKSPAWKSEQFSQIHCQNTNLTESVFQGSGDTPGLQQYARTNVPIANATYSGGTDLIFEMRTWRSNYDTPDCSSLANRVDDSTWKITVYLCPSGDLSFVNQPDVDDYISNNSHCNCVNGNLELAWGTIDDISGLNFIDCITGNLSIHNLNSLTSLGGLDNIDTIFNDLIISSNGQLSDLTGLSSLQYVSRDLIIDNNAITDFDGLQNLDSVGQVFNISNNNLIGNFFGLSSLTKVGINFDITSNNNLADFSGLTQFESAGWLYIIDNQNLLSLNGFQTLDALNFLTLEDNINLNNLTAIPNLTTLDLLFVKNSALPDLSGLDSIVTISYLYVSENPSLTSLNGLDKLKKINSEPAITFKSIISLLNNPMLSDISALSNLEIIEDSLVIVGNASLTNLSGLNNLAQIGTIKIGNNDNLSDIDSLGIFEIITGDVIIQDNDNLTSIDFLRDINKIFGSLQIIGNTNLSMCCPAFHLIPDKIQGISIMDNDVGCNSYSEINSTCILSDPDQDNIDNATDNCPDIYNPNQEDLDSDGIGNACDNCPTVANPGQEDANNNFIGTACENPEPGLIAIETGVSDLYLNNEQNGIIMKNPNGNCYRLIIDLEGQLQIKLIDCP